MSERGRRKLKNRAWLPTGDPSEFDTTAACIAVSDGHRTTKEFDSASPCARDLMTLPNAGLHQENDMSEKTCAACDYPLDGNAIKVTIGHRVVEVCCEECAEKLREAQSKASA